MRTVSCPFCGGTGQVRKSPSATIPYSHYDNCRSCKGSGKLKSLIPFQVFAKSNKRKFLWGLFWYLEALFELQLAGWFLPRYLWEIVGPVNIGLFLSSFIAIVYATLSLFMSFLGLLNWFREKYQ